MATNITPQHNATPFRFGEVTGRPAHFHAGAWGSLKGALDFARSADWDGVRLTTIWADGDTDVSFLVFDETGIIRTLETEEV